MSTTSSARKSKRPPAWVWLAGFGVLFLVVVTMAVIITQRPADLAQAKAWDIRAAPCPEVTAAAFLAQPVKLKQQFDYEGMLVSRAFGHADCDLVSEGGWKTFVKYPSCQLTGPGVMTIKAKGQTHYFMPGVGSRATVSLRNGKLTCVLDAEFGKPRES